MFRGSEDDTAIASQSKQLKNATPAKWPPRKHRMPDKPYQPHLHRQLGIIAAIMLVLMTLFEGVKQFLLPDITIWESHTITIAFTTLLATIVSYFVLKSFHGNYQDRLKEIIHRRAAEEAFKTSEAKYRLLFEQSRDAIGIATSEGRFIDVNPAYERLFGYGREELLNMNAEQIWHSREERDRWRAKMAAEGFVANFECRQRRKDGREIIILRTSTQRQEAGGQLIYQSICRDITQRKKFESEREQLISDLKQALSEIKTLSGLLPICASCKRIRDDKGYWQQIETYISEHSDTVFSHGICPECTRKLYPQIKGIGRTTRPPGPTS